MIKTKGGFEPKVLADLDNRGKVYTYESLELPYVLKRTYTPDLVLNSGIIVELKGKFDRDAQKKMIAVKKTNPHLDIRIVFQKLKSSVLGAAKRKDGTRMSCEQWAVRNGFLYAEGTVPDSWFKHDEDGDISDDEEEFGEYIPPFRDQGAE